MGLRHDPLLNHWWQQSVGIMASCKQGWIQKGSSVAIGWLFHPVEDCHSCHTCTTTSPPRLLPQGQGVLRQVMENLAFLPALLCYGNSIPPSWLGQPIQTSTITNFLPVGSRAWGGSSSSQFNRSTLPLVNDTSTLAESKIAETRSKCFHTG